MSNDTIKGPGWWILGVFLFAGLSALVRWLNFPETWSGVLLKTAVQVAGMYGVIILCVTGTPTRRRLLISIPISFPIVLFGNTGWRLYLRGLSAEDQELVTELVALCVGIGIGGTIAAWIFQSRNRVRSS
jgi:hypothetical protein